MRGHEKPALDDRLNSGADEWLHEPLGVRVRAARRRKIASTRLKMAAVRAPMPRASASHRDGGETRATAGANETRT